MLDNQFQFAVVHRTEIDYQLKKVGTCYPLLRLPHRLCHNTYPIFRQQVRQQYSRPNHDYIHSREHLLIQIRQILLLIHVQTTTPPQPISNVATDINALVPVINVLNVKSLQ